MILLFLNIHGEDKVFLVEAESFQTDTTIGYEIHSQQIRTNIRRRRAVGVQFWTNDAQGEPTTPIQGRLYHTEMGHLILRPLGAP
jgi:hypothetical protein